MTNFFKIIAQRNNENFSEWLKQFNELQYKFNEFQAYTGYSLEQFKQLLLSGVIKIEPTRPGINNNDIHDRIKKVGLQYTIESLRPKLKNLEVLKNADS